MNEIKLCKDCRHMTPEQKCGRPDAVKIDYVNGNHKMFECQVERAFSTATGCGPDAKHFEASEPTYAGRFAR
jgi:hypothetical protein